MGAAAPKTHALGAAAPGGGDDMFWELIATLMAGFAAAGVVLLLNKILRGRLPKWAMPIAAGGE